MRKLLMHPLKIAGDYVPIPDKVEEVVKLYEPEKQKKKRAMNKLNILANSLGLSDMYFYHYNTRKRNKCVFILGRGDPVKGYHRFQYWKKKTEQDFLEMAKEIKRDRSASKFSEWSNKDSSHFSKSYHRVKRDGIRGYSHMMFIHNIIKQYERFLNEA